MERSKYNEDGPSVFVSYKQIQIVLEVGLGPKNEAFGLKINYDC